MNNRSLSHISRIALLAAICFGFMLSSCGSKKQVTTTVPVSQTSVKVTDTDAKQSLQTYSTAWERLSVPLTVRLRKPSSISISGTALMERGKSVTLSLRFLGMEMAVMHLTSDSIVALDKYHSRYVAESLRNFLGGVPVNITNVQDLVLGRPFLLGSTRSAAADINAFEFENDAASGCITMIPKAPVASVEYGFTFDAAMQLLGLIVKAGNGEPVTVTYGQPELTTFGPIAASTSVAATFGKTQVDASLEWSPRKAKWNNDVKLRTIEIPSKYQRISASSLLKMFSSL